MVNEPMTDGYRHNNTPSLRGWIIVKQALGEECIDKKRGMNDFVYSDL